MNLDDLENLKLYENWLERNIDFQKNRKGNVLGYEDNLNSEGAYNIRRSYIELCRSVFCEFGIEDLRSHKYLDKVNSIKMNSKELKSLIIPFGITLDCMHKGKETIFESSLNSLRSIFPEL